MIEAMKQARDFISRLKFADAEPEPEIVMAVLDQAIAEAEKQEPVAMQMDVIVVNLVREGINKHRARELAEHFIKHTHPPKREWVGLTLADREELRDQFEDWNYPSILINVIEAKLKQKNT